MSPRQYFWQNTRVCLQLFRLVFVSLTALSEAFFFSVYIHEIRLQTFIFVTPWPFEVWSVAVLKCLPTGKKTAVQRLRSDAYPTSPARFQRSSCSRDSLFYWTFSRIYISLARLTWLQRPAELPVSHTGAVNGLTIDADYDWWIL